MSQELVNPSSIVERFSQLPIRSRIAVPIFLVLFIVNVLVFKYVEGHSWITSIYFVIILLTTVGFGDVVPSNDFSRILVILLVISGFVTFAFAAEDIFENILKERFSNIGSIPTKTLNLENHIIIGGYGSKGRRVASLLRDRGFEIIVIDPSETAQIAIAAGYRTIITDVSKIDVLEKLNLDKAKGIFLLLNDDHATIHAAIHARSISQNVLIYAELRNAESDEVARYVGIDNPILLSTSLASNLREILREDHSFIPYDTRTLVTQQASIGYIRSKNMNNIFEEFNTAQLLGTVNLSLNTFQIAGRSPEFDINSVSDRYEYLFSVDRNQISGKHGYWKSLLQDDNRKIHVAGYSQIVKDTLSKLDLQSKQLTVLWSNEEEYDRAKEDGHFLVKWEVNKSAKIVSELVNEGDIVLSFFEDVTDSLILALSLKRKGLNQNLVQTVVYEREVKPFVRAGTNFVVPSQYVVADLILREFFNDAHIPPSVFHGNSHIFEQVVTEDNLKYWRRRLRSLGYDNLALIYSNKLGRLVKFDNKKMKLNEGDRLLIMLKKSFTP